LLYQFLSLFLFLAQYFVYILFLLFYAHVALAQSLYNERANTKLSYTNQEAFSISFEKSMYGITFNPNDRKLNNDLKNRIERFMNSTNRQKYRGLGKFTIDIVKRNGKYYVVEQLKPEMLWEL